MNLGNERLSSVLAQRTLSEPAVLDIAVEIAEELAQLHQQGRTHGAVTPENAILVRGTVCLDRPPADLSTATPADDVRQYAALLRQLLAAAGSRPDAAEFRTMLEPILNSYL